MLRMLRKVVCSVFLLSGLSYVPSILWAQEATTMNGAQAVRFEQSPGFYHYIAFCRTPREFTTQVPPVKVSPDSMEYALCWYVNGARTGEPAEADGRIIVSEHHVRFIPRDPRASGLYFDLPRDQAELKREPGQPYATLQGKEAAFRFRFSNLCLTCAPGAAMPPGSVPASLDREFGLLAETIGRYTSGWREIYRISSGSPANPSSRGQMTNSVAKNASRPGPLPEPARPIRTTETSTPATSAIGRPAPASAEASAVPAKVAAPVVIGGPKAKPVKIASTAADGLLVKKIAPDYPLEAKLVRLEGTVMVRAVIDKAGEVAEVSALSGPPILESAAIDAVKQWQYRPFSQNGQPVDVETTIAVVFALDGSRALRPQSARR